jgi:glucosyl-3-phosphoglycerate synthase
VRYVRAAEDAIECYAADAQLNGLSFDRHEEERAVAAFARAVRLAAFACREDLKGTRLPSWRQVFAALPDFAETLLDAVAMDNEVPALQLV